MSPGKNDLDQLCINTIRMLSVDAVQAAESGHPGAPMGLAPLAYVLWTRFLKHHPENPEWINRDRFVLSAGHASMLLYSLLHLTGYDLPLEEIKRFRQWGSKTPGHPEYGHAPGVETTTGPLGQGFGNSVGMAIAERFLAQYFNRPGHTMVDHYTYVIVSDGDMMEGLTSEAASLAGHLRLGKLICFYDDNHISIEGSTALAFSEDVRRRFEAYGWHIAGMIGDGNDLKAIEKAIRAAQSETNRPSLIIVRTIIGYGSPNRSGDARAHGEALGVEEVKATKKNLGWPLEPAFYIPKEAQAQFQQVIQRGRKWQEEWQKMLETYTAQYPDLAKEWDRVVKRELPPGWDEGLLKLKPSGSVATRRTSGEALNAMASHLPNLIGGSADLAPSTSTLLKGFGDLSGKHFGPQDRNMHFGVREHGMGAILNGMAVHGGLIPYGATFLIFSDYMRPAIRLAALMKLPVTYVFTHDSVGLGEDGPTHQPIEHLAGLRAIPGLTVIRPADATETVAAWRFTIDQGKGPVALVLTRQKLPVLDRNRYPGAEGVLKGGYVLTETNGKKPDVILIGTGSEVHLVLEAGQELESQGMAVRVVSLPSWELFEKQTEAYRSSVLPPEIPVRLAVEAASTMGWHRYVGDKGDVVGLDRFGASAPGKTVLAELGFNVKNIISRVQTLLNKGN